MFGLTFGSAARAALATGSVTAAYAKPRITSNFFMRVVSSSGLFRARRRAQVARDLDVAALVARAGRTHHELLDNGALRQRHAQHDGRRDVLGLGHRGA